MAVSTPVYTVKGWFTTCVPQFLEHTAGINQMLVAMYVRLLLVGDHSPLPITLPSAVSELFSDISSVSLHISTGTKRVKCFIKHVLCIVLGVRAHNLCAGPKNKTFCKHAYIHTLSQISTPHCIILASLPTWQLHNLPGPRYAYIN